MDPREQSALAPLRFRAAGFFEASTEGESAGFDSQKRIVDSRCGQMQLPRQTRCSDRSGMHEPAVDELFQCVIRTWLRSFYFSNFIFEDRFRVDRAKCSQLLGRNPKSGRGGLAGRSGHGTTMLV